MSTVPAKDCPIVEMTMGQYLYTKSVQRVIGIPSICADRSIGHPSMANRSSWLVAGISPKAPASVSLSMWVLETLGQAAETSSTEMNLRPLACSARDRAAVSPSPATEMKGGISALCS